MHHSRLAGFIIDCQDADLDQAGAFWSAALGMAEKPADDDEDTGYRLLDTGVRDLHIEVQRVRHESRLHLDIETDDIAAEVARLEALGATALKAVHSWVVMQAPTGQRFCVVRARRPLSAANGATRWD